MWGDNRIESLLLNLKDQFNICLRWEGTVSVDGTYYIYGIGLQYHICTYVLYLHVCKFFTIPGTIAHQEITAHRRIYLKV